MTKTEEIILDNLLKCRFRAFGSDKRIVRLIAEKRDRKIKPTVHDYLIRLFHKYKRQIAQYETLCAKLHLINKA